LTNEGVLALRIGGTTPLEYLPVCAKVTGTVIDDGVVVDVVNAESQLMLFDEQYESYPTAICC
jgi:hypothetical protein